MRRSTASTSLLSLLLAGVLAAQQPPARPEPGQRPPVTFKVEIDYVEVDAVVTDSRGNFVDDLTLEDFEIFENGKPQRVELFTLVDLPIERAERPLFAATPIEPDVRTNAREFDGRLYLIVLDDLHTHALRSALVKRAAREFIEQHLGANDIAAVVHTSGRSGASQEFTSNPRLLLEAVDKFMGRRLRSSTQERLDEYYRQRDMPGGGFPRRPGERIQDPRDLERSYQARTALQTVRSMAEVMAGVRGRRKALVLFSEGIDYDIHDIFGSRDASIVLDAARETIGAATRANVSIFAVDPRGLTSLGDDAIEIQGFPEDPNEGLGVTSLHHELRVAQDSLRMLADETGGFATLNSNDFSQAFARLVRENSSYYVLGYYPEDTRRDGRFRRIEVRVKRPDVQVRARKGYIAPRGRPETRRAEEGGLSPELRETLMNPLPVSGLTLSVFAAPFRGAAPNSSVAVGVEIDGSTLTFTERDGLFVNDVELSMAAWDDRGRAHGGDRAMMDLKLRPQTHDAVRQAGLRLISRLDLPPGRYQLRIAARESGAGAVGSLHYDLEVPEFSREPLVMSGLVLTSTSAAATPTPQADEELRQVLPAPPTTRRTFTADEVLAIFTEVYDNVRRPHLVDIVATLRADEGRVVFKAEDQRSSDELGRAGGGYGYTTEVPLRDLAPGPYVLRVEARSRLASGAPVFRETLLWIRAADAAGATAGVR